LEVFSLLDKFFSISKHGSTVRTEIIAGITTFFTMVYIVIVNPAILSSVGVPFDQVFMATIIASVVGTLIMGLYAKYPIAIAPGMGLNAYFATVVATHGLSNQTVFGAVFLAGLLFILLSVSNLRQMIMTAIPPTLKYGITSGIGLFIAFLGLKQAGIIVANESNYVIIQFMSEKRMILITLTIIFVFQG